MRCDDLPGRLDPVQPWHAQVHQDQIGIVFGGKTNGLAAIRGLGDYLQFWCGVEEHAESRANQPVVVHQKHGGPGGERSDGGCHRAAAVGVVGRWALTCQPLPSAPAVSVPPASRTRSRMPMTP
jgi:hypothetical protein